MYQQRPWREEDVASVRNKKDLGGWGQGGASTQVGEVVGQATSCQEHWGATGQLEKGSDGQRFIWLLCGCTVDSRRTRVGQGNHGGGGSACGAWTRR